MEECAETPKALQNIIIVLYTYMPVKPDFACLGMKAGIGPVQAPMALEQGHRYAYAFDIN